MRRAYAPAMHDHECLDREVRALGSAQRTEPLSFREHDEE